MCLLTWIVVTRHKQKGKSNKWQNFKTQQNHIIAEYFIGFDIMYFIPLFVLFLEFFCCCCCCAFYVILRFQCQISARKCFIGNRIECIQCNENVTEVYKKHFIHILGIYITTQFTHAHARTAHTHTEHKCQFKMQHFRNRRIIRVVCFRSFRNNALIHIVPYTFYITVLCVSWMLPAKSNFIHIIKWWYGGKWCVITSGTWRFSIPKWRLI